MNTLTQTYTKTDVRRVFENFKADLLMLALRTQAMEIEEVDDYVHDILKMAQHKCLKYVHVQLHDCYGNRIKVHRYSVKENSLSNSQRPGANRWPCLPDGDLIVLVEPTNSSKWRSLQNLGKFQISWGPSNMSTDYSGMQNEGVKLYSSNSYGLQRDTFVNL